MFDKPPKNESKKEGIEYPKDLTELDIELVHRQCEYQSATRKEDIEGFALAYSEAKKIAYEIQSLSQLSPEEIEGLILHWANLIDTVNKKGYRKVPVTFTNGNTAAPAEEIPRLMSLYSHAYAEGLLTPEEAYEQFEKIHPFRDGNGRVGDLLWKVATKIREGDWPNSLPPDIFGDQPDEEEQ